MTDPNSQPVKVLVAYYSATGHVHALARAVAEGACEAGAEVRVRHVEELAPELLISQNQAWGRHRSEVGEEPTATLGDLEWADGIAFGTPTRFGNVAAQLKMFLDEAGELWQRGELINKRASCTSGTRVGEPDPETRAVAIAQGGRLARVAPGDRKRSDERDAGRPVQLGCRDRKPSPAVSAPERSARGPATLTDLRAHR